MSGRSSMGAQEQGIDASRWTVIPRSLCFVTHGNDVLLLQRGMHKRAFPGRYNGLGGHVERGEDPLTSAIREIHEESGLDVHNVRYRGTLHIDANGSVGILLFVFTAEAAGRAVRDTDEGILHWVPLDEAVRLPLVDDLPELLDRLFGTTATDQPFFAHVGYDAQDRRVTRWANP